MVRRTFQLICVSVMVMLIHPNKVSGQWLWLDLNFDGYNGTSATLPPGIFVSWNSTSPASYYTSVGNFGWSAPSYKFGNDGDYITTFMLPMIDSISFWMKGNGSPFSPQNELRFYISTDSINFIPLFTLDSLPASGTNISIPMNQVTGNLKIEYGKATAGGNLAFDDFRMYSSIVIGINETNEENPIVVFPSPTTGQVNIKMKYSAEKPEVEVFDSIGNKIAFGSLEQKSPGHYMFDINNYKKGFYFVKIRNGYQFVTKRITLAD